MTNIVKQDSKVQVVKEGEYQPFNTRAVVGTLEKLMTKVTDSACTAETVNAACNCAGRIADILRIHLDVERLRRTR